MENKSPSTSVGQLSSLEVRPFKKIWCKNKTVSLLRNIELTSSWVQGGFFDDAAILNGRKKQETRTSICSIYSSSASTILKTRLFLLRILSACGLLMYCSTICFHLLRHSQPLKKLWTFFIFLNSWESSGSLDMWEGESEIPCDEAKLDVDS